MCLVLSVAWNVCGRCHGDTRRIPPSKREQIQLMRGHTHNLTQYTRSHSKWWHGNTTVNPDWGPSAGLTSLRPPQKKQACWSLQHHSGSHCRLLRDVAGYSKFTFLFASPAFFVFFFLFLNSACFCFCICLRQEVSVWRGEIRMQGEPHPSTHPRHKQVWRACHRLKMFRGGSSATSRYVWDECASPLIVPAESGRAFGVLAH